MTYSENRGEKIEIIPAIDIRGGRCVRLFQGDFSKETIFADDPVEVALRWQSMGATRLHIVDLDGAASGDVGNFEVIRSLIATVVIPVEIGGGIRLLPTIEKYIEIGADRVILGTSAVNKPEMVKEACSRFRQSIVVSIDARGGFVASHGWQNTTQIPSVEFARSMVQLGVRRFIHTDIGRDGTLTEPNFSALFELIDCTKFPVIASGGITSILHLKLLSKLGAEGAIVGRALYTQDINLSQALAAVEN
ncbi:MAG: 1-(5-phosphoribosyl)-5-[(5-phosphoribosylamino)methylideneamino]imidazole-4-carboxamide isomerase [Dehalococcoidia bacterium]|nr:1-(5-phosphoribosyl)-5-[(5-phosphoribosylamino)methylideneamino]imidazole-4-carboxamide isomerase [Dehalococcoidia bacterium]